MRYLDPLDDSSRHAANVRSPMAPNVRLIPHPPQGYSDELPVQRCSDRAGKARFAHPWGAHEAQDRAFCVVLQLSNGQVLDDPAAMGRETRWKDLFIPPVKHAIILQRQFLAIYWSSTQHPVLSGRESLSVGAFSVLAPKYSVI
jgi:hypothetical protein